MEKPAWSVRAHGIEITVRLTPRSSRDAMEGSACPDGEHSHLCARVRAVPEDGKANQALLRLLSDCLDVPVSHMQLVGGTTSRLKRVLVSGRADELVARLKPHL